MNELHEIEIGFIQKIATGYKKVFVFAIVITFIVFMSPLTSSPVSQLKLFIFGMLPAILIFSLLLKYNERIENTKYYVNILLILTILFSAITLHNPEIFSLFYLLTALNIAFRDRLLHFVSSAVQLGSYLLATIFFPILLPAPTAEDSTMSLLITRIALFVMMTFLVDIINFYTDKILQNIIQRESDINAISVKDTMGALIQALEAKDIYTNGHSLRTSSYAISIAKMLPNYHLDEENIKIGAILHDIGKIGISDTILTKPGFLTSEEFEIIKSHPLIGAKILENTKSLIHVVPMVLYHHERYDGKGYPQGLAGDNIPIEARILAVVDTFDAMTSNRPYRTPLPVEKAVNEIVRNAGTQFCPIIVQAFVAVYDEIKLTFN